MEVGARNLPLPPGSAASACRPEKACSCAIFLNGTDAIAYTAILSVDNHIGLVFSGQSFCFSNGCFLRSMFGGDPLIPLTPYGPYPFIGDYVLVPGPSLFALARAFEKELHQFAQKIYPGSGFAAFWHLAFFGTSQYTLFDNGITAYQYPNLALGIWCLKFAPVTWVRSLRARWFNLWTPQISAHSYKNLVLTH